MEKNQTRTNACMKCKVDMKIFLCIIIYFLSISQGRIVEYLQKVHEYMTTLTYNHTGTQFFETKPNSSMLTLMETAKCMIREGLPIKCMEAVVLSIYLTNGVPCLGRFPINFKSELPARAGMSQKYFYHVVLGLAHGNRFGAIGLRLV